MMHSYFGEWYRFAGIPPENIPLEKRWQAIEDFEVDVTEVVLLAQLFYGLRLSDASFAEKFRSVFNKADQNFQMSGNDRELTLLAGATLTNAMERHKREIADLVGLVLVCAALQNIRKVAVPQIPELAAQYLGRRSANRAQPEHGGPESKLFDALKAVGAVQAELATEFRKLQLEFPIIAEEVNALWWLFSEASRDSGQRLSEMPVESVCLIVAKELADLTRIIPGPFAARAFLDKALRTGRKKIGPSITIANAVNGTPKEWRDKYFNAQLSNELASILPINHAVRLSVQSPDEDAWRPMFEGSTGVSPDSEIAPIAIAYQTYLELLVVHAVRVTQGAS